jgi:hypothetical protein
LSLRNAIASTKADVLGALRMWMSSVVVSVEWLKVEAIEAFPMI